MSGGCFSISDIAVTRETKEVLVGGSASAPVPGITLLSGPNGSGKTTLLEVIAGILPADRAVLSFRGEEADPRSDSWREATAILPADGGTIPVLTCAEQLRLMLELSEVSLSESRFRIERLADVFGLAGHLNSRSDALSTGLRKRLGLALVAATPSRVVLLDEPSAGLDADGVSIMLRTIRAFADSGSTVIVASNSVRTFDDLPDELWRLSQGRDGARLECGAGPGEGLQSAHVSPSGGPDAGLSVSRADNQGVLFPWLQDE